METADASAIKSAVNPIVRSRKEPNACAFLRCIESPLWMLLRWMLLRLVVEVKRSSPAKISLIHRERVQDLIGFIWRFA